jgi:hypothetical protein
VREEASIGLSNYCQNVLNTDARSYYLSSVSLVRESCEGKLRERFASLAMRKWYVFGDRSMNPDTKAFLDEQGIPYLIVPESGHFMMDDQPSLFYSMLFGALNK